MNKDTFKHLNMNVGYSSSLYKHRIITEKEYVKNLSKNNIVYKFPKLYESPFEIKIEAYDIVIKSCKEEDFKSDEDFWNVVDYINNYV